MNAVTAIERAAATGTPLRLSADGAGIEADRPPAPEIRETLAAHKPEALFRLAEREHAEVLATLEELRRRIDDESIPLQERETLARTELDRNLDRLSVLERVLSRYERSGLGQWYTEGWLMLQSELLGETVVVVRDEKVKLPGGARRFPVYVFHEVKALECSTDEEILQTHTVKKAFNGEVVTT